MKNGKPLFPVLESKIAETGITKKSIADQNINIINRP